MKILVMSDSHGSDEKLAEIIELNKDADMIVFLGDGERDFECALATCNIAPFGSIEKQICQVRGNCDRSSFEAVTLLENVGDKRLLITHGFDQGVKLGTNRLAMQARELGCQAALFGHTHREYLSEKEGVILFNPGSARNGSYGIVTIDKNKMVFDHKSL